MVCEKKSPGFLSISKAHDCLVEKGICALDGSGDPDVEALFSRIAIVRKELEELRVEIVNSVLLFPAKSFLNRRISRILNYL